MNKRYFVKRNRITRQRWRVRIETADQTRVLRMI